MDKVVDEILARLDKKLKYDFDPRAFCQSLIEENLCTRAKCNRKISSQDNKIRAIWVLSGSGSYYKKLLPVKTDQVHKHEPWYYGLDKVRLEYVSKINRDFKSEPYIFYNGRKVQNDDLLRAIGAGKLSIKKENLFLIDGQIRSTLQQIENFKFPVRLNEGEKMAILSNTAHLFRILRYMAAHEQSFLGVKIVLLPVCLSTKEAEDEMMKGEIKGIIESVAKHSANMEPYPYEITR